MIQVEGKHLGYPNNRKEWSVKAGDYYIGTVWQHDGDNGTHYWCANRDSAKMECCQTLGQAIDQIDKWSCGQ